MDLKGGSPKKKGGKEGGSMIGNQSINQTISYLDAEESIKYAKDKRKKRIS